MKTTNKKILHIGFTNILKNPIAMNYISGNETLIHTTIKKNKLYRLIELIKKIYYAIKRENNENTNIYCHTHDIISILITISLKKIFFKDIIVIYDSHEIYTTYFKNKITKFIVSNLENIAINSSDKVIFPSQERKKFYTKIKQKNIFIIENKYNLKEQGKIEEYLKIISTTTNNILFNGTLHPRRGINEVIRAFEDERLNNYNLYIFGEKNDYIKKVVEKNHHNIHYLGYVEHSSMISILNKFICAFALYSPIDDNNYLCAPTKIYEFSYYNLPIISNKLPFLSYFKKRYKVNEMFFIEKIKKEEIINILTKKFINKNNIKKPIEYKKELLWSSNQQIIEKMYS